MKALGARILDGSAVGLSGLCLVHCLALPLMAALLPAFGAWARADGVHIVFVLLAAPVSAAALLRPAHGRHAPMQLIMLGVAGVGLLAAGAFGPEPAHVPATVAGSLTLAVAHLCNWRRQARTQPVA